MEDLKERTLRGGFSKVGAQGASFAMRLGSMMILARMLEPGDFGLVGMVTAATGVFNLLKDFGLSTATVQRASVTEAQVSTLFWLNMLVAAILSGLTVAAAPLLVEFYHEPRLLWITTALASGFLFNGAAVQHTALLQREMRFGTLALIELLSLLVSIAVGIGMAMAGYDYWALVGMAVSAPIVSAIGVWLAAGWIPGWPHRRCGIRSMLRFGGTVTLNGLVVYIAYNLEKVLLGRFWGADALGIYGRSYQLINIPTENLNSAVGGVAFSALSRLQDDPERFKRYFLKGYSLVIGVTVPITLGCVLFADELVFVLLGPKWSDAADIFRFLSPTILVFALINPTWWLLGSSGRVGRSLKIALVIAPLTISAYLIGLPYGPAGVACAYSTAMVLWVVPHLIWCAHGTVVSVRELLIAAGRPVCCGLLAAAMVSLTQSLCQPLIPYGLMLRDALGPSWLDWGSAPLSIALGRLVLGGAALLIAYLWMLLYVLGQKPLYASILQSFRRLAPIPAGISEKPEEA
jgi:O-antigen/teichoic acid export membrane protein